MKEEDTIQPTLAMPATRGLPTGDARREFAKKIIIALDTGSGKTHILAVLQVRLKPEMERERGNSRPVTVRYMRCWVQDPRLPRHASRVTVEA